MFPYAPSSGLPRRACFAYRLLGLPAGLVWFATVHTHTSAGTMPSRDRKNKRNGKASGDGRWRSVEWKPSSKSTRTNCYRYIIIFSLFYIFIIKDLGRTVISSVWDSIDRKVKLTRVWFALFFFGFLVRIFKRKSIRRLVDCWCC